MGPVGQGTVGCPGKSQRPSLSGQPLPGSGPGGWGEGWARCKGSPATSLLSLLLPPPSSLPETPPMDQCSPGDRAGTQNKSNLTPPQRPAQELGDRGRFQSSASNFEDALLTQPRGSAEMFESQAHGPAHPEPMGLSALREGGRVSCSWVQPCGPLSRPVEEGKEGSFLLMLNFIYLSWREARVSQCTCGGQDTT